jgi:hypothetical protein
MGPGWATPDPGVGMAIEMLGGDPRHEGNVMIIGQRLPREGFAPEDAPPAFNEIEPGRSYRNEGMLDPRMGFEPLSDRTTGVAGQVISNQVKAASRIGAVQRLEQVEVAHRVTGARGLGQCPAVADRESPIDPDFRRSPVVIQGDLDPVPVGRPPRCRREIARGYRAELVDAEDGRSLRWLSVEADDSGSFGTKSGSLLLAHKRVWRQRTFSCW